MNIRILMAAVAGVVSFFTTPNAATAQEAYNVKKQETFSVKRNGNTAIGLVIVKSNKDEIVFDFLNPENPKASQNIKNPDGSYSRGYFQTIEEGQEARQKALNYIDTSSAVIGLEIDYLKGLTRRAAIEIKDQTRVQPDFTPQNQPKFLIHGGV